MDYPGSDFHHMPPDYHHLGMDMELDPRTRSSTWPLRDPALLNAAAAVDSDNEQLGGYESPRPGTGMELKAETPECESPIPQHSKSEPKPAKMRNAWGNMSYAELITQAVLSSPEKRLTLSEIYDWIVKNVPYFTDKANSPSTAGWKNSVRHNLSLHSRFVKIQNDTSGKSSWWTVDLDAKSNKTSRRNRSHSVDNTNNSPRSRKREKKSKIKKIKGASSQDNILSSPCHSPTPLLQPSWSPRPSCPSPTGSDLSPGYSPILQSPIMHRGSRNVTPVSPLISPPGIDQQCQGVFSGSNSSLLDADGQLGPDLGDPNTCSDMLAQLNIRPSREHMGSSSSLSSLNSPRFLAVNKSPHPVFTFAGPVDSSGYSSISDTEVPTEGGSLPPPPPYEDHLPHQQSRPTCYTPTRSGAHPHPLQITLSAESRPRSGSEPVAVNLTNRFPQDIDMELFQAEPNFDCDVNSIIQKEMQYGNAQLDFQFTPNNHNHHQHHHHHHHQVPNRIQHHRYSHPATLSPHGDPTLTSAALQGDPILMQGHKLANGTAYC